MKFDWEYFDIVGMFLASLALLEEGLVVVGNFLLCGPLIFSL